MSTSEQKERIRQLAKGDEFKQALRIQVLEMIVQRAMANAPWERIWSGPMKIHGITADEVYEELNRRKAAGSPPAAIEDDVITLSEVSRPIIEPSCSLQAPSHRPKLRHFIWQGSAAPTAPIYMPDSQVPPLPGQGAQPITSWRAVDNSDDFFIKAEKQRLVAELAKRCQFCKTVIEPGEQFCRCGMDLRHVNPFQSEPEELKPAAEELTREQLAVQSGEAQRQFLERLAVTLNSPWQHQASQLLQPAVQKTETQVNDDYKRCPRCEKWIGKCAIFCHFCHLDFTIPPEQTTPPPRLRGQATPIMQDVVACAPTSVSRSGSFFEADVNVD